MKCLGLFVLRPGWDGSPSQGYPQHYTQVGWHPCTLGWREVAQEHNTISLARDQTWTTRSRDECTNHVASPPPTVLIVTVITLFLFYRKRKMFLPVKLSQYNIPRDIRRCLLDGGDLGSIVHALREVNKDTGRSSII